MIRTTLEPGAGLLGAAALVLLAWPLGCASVLGLESWSDPPGTGGATTSTTTSSTTSTTTSSTVTITTSSTVTTSTSSTVTTTSSTVTTSTTAPVVPDAGPTCADGIKDGMETDVDCGGDACLPCAAGETCNDDADCQSGNCALGGGCSGALCCQSHASDAGPPDGPDPTCADGIKNGLETGVDCGGDACPPCASGEMCKDDADCKSGHCVSLICQ